MLRHYFGFILVYGMALPSRTLGSGICFLFNIYRIFYSRCKVSNVTRSNYKLKKIMKNIVSRHLYMVLLFLTEFKMNDFQ